MVAHTIIIFWVFIINCLHFLRIKENPPGLFFITKTRRKFEELKEEIEKLEKAA